MWTQIWAEYRKVFNTHLVKYKWKVIEKDFIWNLYPSCCESVACFLLTNILCPSPRRLMEECHFHKSDLLPGTLLPKAWRLCTIGVSTQMPPPQMTPGPSWLKWPPKCSLSLLHCHLPFLYSIPTNWNYLDYLFIICPFPLGHRLPEGSDHIL